MPRAGMGPGGIAMGMVMRSPVTASRPVFRNASLQRFVEQFELLGETDGEADGFQRLHDVGPAFGSSARHRTPASTMQHFPHWLTVSHGVSHACAARLQGVSKRGVTCVSWVRC